jgi:hypothetical protein
MTVHDLLRERMAIDRPARDMAVRMCPHAAAALGPRSRAIGRAGA